MLIPSIITLVVALVAVYISFKTREEIKVVAAVLTALICLVFNLIFAPWLIKVVILAAVLVSEQFLSSIIGRYISSSVE